jgi:hypothetical protein
MKCADIVSDFGENNPLRYRTRAVCGMKGDGICQITRNRR